MTPRPRYSATTFKVRQKSVGFEIANRTRPGRSGWVSTLVMGTAGWIIVLAIIFALKMLF